MCRGSALGSDDAKALIVVREAGAIDNATYRALNKVDTLTASAALRRLRDAGLLAQKGRGSATYYVPTERLGLTEPTAGMGGVLSGNPAALSSKPVGLSSKLGDLSSNPPTAAIVATSARFDEAARRALLDDLPGLLAARLGAIGQRHPPQKVQDLVVELCTLRAWRTDELSLVLRRNPEVVRQSYLRPLTREGRLAMTRPQEPNDPQQAYRAVSDSSHRRRALNSSSD